MRNLKNTNTQILFDFVDQDVDLFSSQMSPKKILSKISNSLMLFLEIEKHYYKKNYQALLDRMALIDEGYSFDEALKKIPHPTKTRRKK